MVSFDWGGRGLEIKDWSSSLAQCQEEKVKEEPQESGEGEPKQMLEIKPEMTGRNVSPTGIHRSWGQGQGVA